MKKKKLLLSYIFFDIIAALLTWVLFFTYRKYNVDATLFSHFEDSIYTDAKFFIGLFLYPLFWIFLHAFVGYYGNLLRRSRMKEFQTTISISFIGALLFFFVFIMDDYVNTPYDYVKYFAFLFGTQFILTYIPRLIITTCTINKINSGKIVFKTLIIGSNDIALDTYINVTAQNHSIQIIGYVAIPDEPNEIISSKIPCLGNLNNLTQIIDNNNIEELIIAIQNGKRRYIEDIISMVGVNHDLMLKIIPQTQDYLLGTVKTSSVLHEPFISIYPERLSEWKCFMKRFFDIFLSLIAIILLIPIYIFLIIGVKVSSRGPIFYTQERIGYKGKAFKIIKFRSMIINAESETPLLSSKNDNRITKFGKILRKTHLDETPQFFNVLIGDMSLVGPRPERQYYINQIIKVAPYYKLLQSIRPGITSWGQVKFGYAENVDEMVQRLKWDILYIENMSLSMDVKILLHTFFIIFKGSGK